MAGPSGRFTFSPANAPARGWRDSREETGMKGYTTDIERDTLENEDYPDGTVVRSGT